MSVKSNNDGHPYVSVSESALPTGAATETTLSSILTELGEKLEPGDSVELGATTLAALETINATVSGTVAVSNHPTDFPSSAANTKLDTLIAKDFATSAKQDSGNASLTAIAAKDFATSAKQDTAQTRLDLLATETTLAAVDTKLDTLHTDNGSAGTTPPNGSGVLGWLRGAYDTLVSILARLPAALSSGGGVKVGIVDSLTVGTAGSAALTTATQIGGSDGTNLRALKVNTAGELYERTSATATRTITPASLTVVTLLAANTGRISARIRNTSVTQAIFVKYGSGASLSDYDEIVMANDSIPVMPGYRGVITGIWAVASGNCIATEVA